MTGDCGLTLRFVDFDLVSSTVCPILLGQEKIDQRWANWWNFPMEVKHNLVSNLHGHYGHIRHGKRLSDDEPKTM